MTTSVRFQLTVEISMSEVVNVNVTMGDCDLYAPLVVVPFSEDNICDGGVKVSLTWGKDPLDLDLYSYMVDKNQTSNRCLTYYCDEKNPCGCTSFEKDNRIVQKFLKKQDMILWIEIETFVRIYYLLSGMALFYQQNFLYDYIFKILG